VDDPGARFLEYKQRLVYSLLRAAARVALKLRLPLDQLASLAQMAYFQEARAGQGLKLDAIAGLFGKSLRTVSTLHNRFRGDFFAPEHEVALRRAIAALVNHRPADDARLRAAFADVPEVELASAIDDLVRAGVIVRDGAVWRRNPAAHDFLGATPDDLVARIDGLNRQMDVVAATVWHRLVEPGDRPALARTFVFHASDRDLQAMIDATAQGVRERAIAADVAFDATGDGGRVGFTFAAAPLEEDR
jgi:PAS domain-containing protein